MRRLFGNLITILMVLIVCVLFYQLSQQIINQPTPYEKQLIELGEIHKTRFGK